MIIKPQFQINDLVSYKWKEKDNPNENNLFEVMEIHSVTCYAGTQIFYLTRGIRMRKRRDGGWEIGHGISRDDHGLGYQKYREDELVKSSNELVDFVFEIMKGKK